MKRLTLALLSLYVLAASISVAAMDKIYEGNVVAVDTKARTFTVKGTAKGEAAEMMFRSSPRARSR